MTRTKMGIGMALALLAVGLAAPGGRAEDDFNPVGGAPTGGWAGVMAIDKWGLDGAGKVTAISVKAVEVDANLIAAHCKTKANTSLAHVHYNRKFTAGEVTEADRFFDWFNDVAGGKATRLSNADLWTNCHSTALASTGHGAYLYWLNTPDTGYTDDTDNKAKAQAIAGDLLYYKATSHSSILVKATVTTDPPKTTYKIKWKNGWSGVYETKDANLDKLDTLGSMTGFSATVGMAPGGTWTQDGAFGKEGDLDPAGMVHRKK